MQYNLDDRLFELVSLTLQGKGIKEISNIMGIKYNTLRTGILNKRLKKTLSAKTYEEVYVKLGMAMVYKQIEDEKIQELAKM